MNFMDEQKAFFQPLTTSVHSNDDDLGQPTAYRVFPPSIPLTSPKTSALPFSPPLVLLVDSTACKAGLVTFSRVSEGHTTFIYTHPPNKTTTKALLPRVIKRARGNRTQKNEKTTPSVVFKETQNRNKKTTRSVFFFRCCSKKTTPA
uniref:Uncharacterized protein n=1 Tax=Panagrellus redivivus TaxID=6233 RepID=A0A7E4W857_PANRE